MFTKDINKAILIGDAMETGTVQINSAPARGPDHFPFQVTLQKSGKLVLEMISALFFLSFYTIVYFVP